MSTTPHRAWSPRRRHELLAHYAELRSRLRAAADAERRDRLAASLRLVRDEYRAGLPQRALSRCPHSGEVFTHSIDDHGLDGEWWNHEAAVRRPEKPLDTFFALVGAVTVTGDVPNVPWLAFPGPDVPFVMPWVLEHDELIAVVSSLSVGELSAYAITYFASSPPADLDGVNTWGANEYVVHRPDGTTGWDARAERYTQWDYDLAPWIEQGKLRWIAPGDDTLTLRASVDDCPYLDLPGERAPAFIEAGELWRGSTL